MNNYKPFKNADDRTPQSPPDKKAALVHQKESLSKLAFQQQGSASNPSCSVWVEASAGTGKTKVLSDRVLRLLLDDVNPAKILCLTYTKAAAVEMKTRISQRLAKWAVSSEEDLYSELGQLIGKVEKTEFYTLAKRARTLFAALLDVPGGVKIQTIHSFCQEILQRFPLEAGISPYFSVMDERTAQEALANISQELILKIEHEKDSDLANAMAYLTRRVREFKFPELMSSLAANRTRLMNLLSQYSNVDAFLMALAKKLGIRPEQSKEHIIQLFIESLDFKMLRQIAEALNLSTDSDRKNAAILHSILVKEKIEFDYENYKKVFLTKSGTIAARLASQAAVKVLPDIIDLMQTEALKIQQLEEKMLRLELYESTRAVMTIAGDLIKGYNRYKTAHSLLDYEDLIVLTRSLLENKSVAEWVLFKLDGGISHVLIDEAQDTSPDQWAIIKAVTQEFFAGSGRTEQKRTVFAVGDRKQSIYSFQGADPQEFDRMFKHFKQQSPDFAKIQLEVSFRSAAAVLEFVNLVFAQPDAKAGVVPQQETVRHIPFRLGQEGLVEVWDLAESEQEFEETWYLPVERKTQESSSVKLARQIATKIKTMVASGERLKSLNRPLRYQDFMVLVQRRNSFVEELVRECKNIGVQVSGVDKLKLTEQIAVEDLISLGRFLLLPSDDLSLAEILKSPLFGLDDADLFKLCYQRGKQSLWQRLHTQPEYETVAQILTQLLAKVDYTRPFELFNHVLSTLGGRQKFIGRLGIEAEDALDEFMNLALNFEQNHIPALQNFMRWIESGEVEVKRELDQPGTDVVRLMTVHGSKGLQAPVVILPDTTRIANTKKSGGLLWDDNNIAYFPLNADKYDSFCQAIHEQEKENAFNEYRRLLYVALTRAEDRLYICGCKSKNDISDKSWYSLCKSALIDIAEKNEDGSMTLKSPQLIEVKNEEISTPEKSKFDEPAWLLTPAPTESPLARPLAPSRPDDDDALPAASPLAENGSYYRRGLLIHRLLQLLPMSGDKDQLTPLIDKFLDKNAADIALTSRRHIRNEILQLLQDERFSFIFGAQSKAEVAVTGEVDGRIVAAQIDRLIVDKTKVIIVDFKTNRPAANRVEDVPPIYLKQLDVYQKLVQKIYPDKKVETYILWTNSGFLMKIN